MASFCSPPWSGILPQPNWAHPSFWNLPFFFPHLPSIPKCFYESCLVCIALFCFFAVPSVIFHRWLQSSWKQLVLLGFKPSACSAREHSLVNELHCLGWRQRVHASSPVSKLFLLVSRHCTTQHFSKHYHDNTNPQSITYLYISPASRTCCPVCFRLDGMSTTCNHLDTWGLGLWLAQCGSVKTILLVGRQTDLRTEWPWKLSAVCSGHNGNTRVSLPCVVGFLMVLEDVLTLMDSELSIKELDVESWAPLDTCKE